MGSDPCESASSAISVFDLLRTDPLRRLRSARRHVIKPNEVHLLALPVSCDAQQILNALDPRFTSQIVRDVLESNLLDRFDYDAALVHRVLATHFHMRTRPDSNTASYSSVSNSFAKAFSEHHRGYLSSSRFDSRPQLKARSTARPGSRT